MRNIGLLAAAALGLGISPPSDTAILTKPRAPKPSGPPVYNKSREKTRNLKSALRALTQDKKEGVE